MVIKKSLKVDHLAEATNGRLHWNDPGMDDFEKGWEDFPLGTRVEIRPADNIWRKGTVVGTPNENDRAIEVKCDKKWHDNLEFYAGCGASVAVFMNSRRGILSNIRKINEPWREIWEKLFLWLKKNFQKVILKLTEYSK